MVSYRLAQQTALWSAYVFHLFILPALFGLLINYRKSKQYQKIEYEDDSPDTVPIGIFLSHHVWMKQSFVVLLWMTIIGSADFVFSGGFYVLAVIGVWWTGRIFHGMWYLVLNKPMPVYLSNPSSDMA